MSVLIKGMEMPKSCYDCPLQGDECFGSIKCGYAKTWGSARMRAVDCPLVPVPPHGRLIDADALEDNNITYYAIPVLANVTDAAIREAELVIRLKDLDAAPTIIPVEPPKEKTYESTMS